MKATISGRTDAELITQCGDLGYRFFEKSFDCSDLKDWLSESEKTFSDLSRLLGGEEADRQNDFKEDIEYCLNNQSSEGLI